MRSFCSVIVALWLIGYSDCKSQPPMDTSNLSDKELLDLFDSPSSPTSAPELVQASGLECPRQNGYFKHEDPTNCEEFYECVDGISTLHKCPEGLQFNEFKGYCDWAFRGLRQGCVEKLDDDDTTWNGVSCVNRGGTVKAKCLTKHGNVEHPPYKWCYTGDQHEDWNYCTGDCTDKDKQHQGYFESKHKCVQINEGNGGKPCRTEINGKPSNKDALDFVRKLNPKVPKGHIYTLFNKPGEVFQIARIVKDDNPAEKEDVCIVKKPVQSWTCNWFSNPGAWNKCNNKGLCIGGFAVVNGHFASESYYC